MFYEITFDVNVSKFGINIILKAILYIIDLIEDITYSLF